MSSIKNNAARFCYEMVPVSKITVVSLLMGMLIIHTYAQKNQNASTFWPDFYSTAYVESNIASDNGPEDALLNPALLTLSHGQSLQFITTSEILGNNVSGILFNWLQSNQISFGVGLFSNYNERTSQIRNKYLDFGNFYGFSGSVAGQVKGISFGWTFRMDVRRPNSFASNNHGTDSFYLTQIGGLFAKLHENLSGAVTVEWGKKPNSPSSASDYGINRIILGFSYTLYKTRIFTLNIQPGADIYNTYNSGVDIGIQTTFRNFSALLYEMEFGFNLNNINLLSQNHSLDDYLTHNIPEINFITKFTIPLFHEKTLQIGYCYQVLFPYPNQHIISTVIQI